MKTRKITAFVLALSLIGAVMCGCSSDSKSKNQKSTASLSDNDLNPESTTNEENSEPEKAPEANFHVGADFNNLLNGGHITENDEYIFFDNYNEVYRYDKSDGESMVLSGEEGKFLNVSEDGYLYVVRNDGSSYAHDDSVYRINTETGAEELIVDGMNCVEYNCSLSSNVSELEITYMVLAGDKLLIRFDVLCYHAEDYCFFGAFDVNDKTFSLLHSFSEFEYNKDLNVNMCVLTAFGDELYYAYQEAMGELKLCTYNPYMETTDAVVLINSSSGQELNMGRKSSVDGYDDNGNLVRGLYTDYDVKFFDFVSDGAIACLFDKHPFVYDLSTGVVNVYDNALQTLRGDNEWLSVMGKAFHDGRYYLLDSNKGVLWLSEDFSDGGVLCVPDNLINCGYYGENGGVMDCGFGYADDSLWLISENNVVRLNLDGNEEKIDLSDSEKIIDPNDDNCYGTIIGTQFSGGTLGARFRTSLNSFSSSNIAPGTKVIVLCKMLNYHSDYTGSTADYYKVELENGDIGYILDSFVSVEQEPDEIIDYADTSSSEQNKNEETPEIQESQEVNLTGVVITESDALNVRSGASTDYEKIGTVDKGSTVSIISKEGDWYLIEYNGSTGYVSGEFISVND